MPQAVGALLDLVVATTFLLEVMRIGELAALVGVTTRTVRHYHRIGLLPEPDRRLNGYREYGLRDAVELARVRRLVELGLSLEEVRDALGDDAGKDLYEVVAELDADLARREQDIRQRRARLAELMKRAQAGGLPSQGPVSTELAEIFEAMGRTSADREGPEPAAAAKDRELLALLEAIQGQEYRAWLSALTGALSDDPEAMARAYDIYARLDEVADADLDDPRIDELAQLVADSMPDGLLRAMPAAGDGDGDTFAEAFVADFPPAQAEVLRRVVRILYERRRP